MGHPAGYELHQLTGWLFLIGGLTLLPVTLLVEGLPSVLTGRNLWGYAYLVLFGGIVSYGLWFRALQRLNPVAVTFLGLINPVTAALLGWVLLGQRLSPWQLVGAGIVLFSVLLGQLTPLPRSDPQRTRERPGAG